LGAYELPIEMEERIDRFSDPNFLHYANDDAVGAELVLRRLPTNYDVAFYANAAARARAATASQSLKNKQDVDTRAAVEGKFIAEHGQISGFASPSLGRDLSSPLACVHHHQSCVGDGFFVPDAVAVKRRASSGVGQDLVVAMRMHANDMTPLDPRTIDPADGADSAIPRVHRQTRMEDFLPPLRAVFDFDRFHDPSPFKVG
jgi:hypothetical protein